MTGMQRMASKMWAPWIVMGLMMVVISFVMGLLLQATEASYFSNSKEVREAAVAGSAIVQDRGFIEVTMAWVPGFKFFGLGLMLGGITFLLATILGNLRLQGGRVQQALGVPVIIPEPPTTAKMFPMFMMLGMMILMAALVISIWLATVAASYWNHSIATELNTAQAGSELLRQLGVLNAVKAWLVPFKFIGMASLFAGIALALVTIVKVLQIQTMRMVEIVSAARKP
ncbi:MAG: hypothetical protein V3U31_02000 [Dehalococcoidia bacterium]